MNIEVNGKNREIENNINITQLLSIYNIKDSTKVVVELNNEIIEYTHYEQTKIKENDKVEIVSFVGGG